MNGHGVAYSTQVDPGVTLKVGRHKTGFYLANMAKFRWIWRGHCSAIQHSHHHLLSIFVPHSSMLMAAPG